MQSSLKLPHQMTATRDKPWKTAMEFNFDEKRVVPMPSSAKRRQRVVSFPSASPRVGEWRVGLAKDGVAVETWVNGFQPLAPPTWSSQTE
jgi:hypothetical protein